MQKRLTDTGVLSGAHVFLQLTGAILILISTLLVITGSILIVYVGILFTPAVL